MIVIEECPNLVVALVQAIHHERFNGMGERTVADIMEEGGTGDQLPFTVIEVELPADQVRKIHRSKGVFEPGMVRTRIDQVREPQLPDIPEALEDRCVEERKVGFADLDIAMYRVLDVFHPPIGTASSYRADKSIE
jgi:hypothetical protein